MVNLKPQFSLDIFSQVNKTVLELKKKFVKDAQREHLKSSIFLTPSPFCRNCIEIVVSKK